MHGRTLGAWIALSLVAGCNIDKLRAEFYMVPPEGSSSAGSSSAGETSAGETSASEGSGSTSRGVGSSGDASGTDESGAQTGGGGSTEGSTTDAPAVCGDGAVEGDEECDDGNAEDRDACDNSCAAAWTIFVTSEAKFTGDISGLTGADTRCRHWAQLAELPRAMHYMALISDSTMDVADRLHHARGWYRLVNGLPVAHGWDALMNEPLENPVNVTELSTTANYLSVWTGTLPGGKAVPGASNCMGWTSVSASLKGYYGESHVIDGGWLHDPLEQFNPSDCIYSSYALYCVEQP